MFVLIMVVAMVELGVWQVHRLEGRRQINAMLEARLRTPAVPIGNLVTPATPAATANDHEFRHVTATGRYDLADQVVVGPESDADDNPGWWLLTPLVLADHTAVIVNRGLIPYDAWSTSGGTAATGVATLRTYDPPDGSVTVTGLVAESQTRQGGLRDPGTGHLTRMVRADLSRYRRQVPDPIDPVFLDLVTSRPNRVGSYPQSVPSPTLGDGPHLSYAIQWFSFTAITLALYPVLLRRRARRAPIDAPPAEPRPATA